MKTAELFVDITIVGFLALMWICGFLFSFVFEISYLNYLLINSSATIVAILLLLIYSFGIIFDYINAAIFSIFKSKNEKELYKDFSVVKVLIANDKIYPIIENYYGRLRILRSIIISIPLITWSFSCLAYFTLLKIKISLCATIFIIVISGSVLFLLSIISYIKRNKDYKGYIQELKARFP
jgi:hypothetical protein